MTTTQHKITSKHHIKTRTKIMKPVTPLHGPSAVINFGPFRASSQVPEA